MDKKLFKYPTSTRPLSSPSPSLGGVFVKNANFTNEAPSLSERGVGGETLPPNNLSTCG